MQPFSNDTGVSHRDSSTQTEGKYMMPIQQHHLERNYTCYCGESDECDLITRNYDFNWDFTATSGDDNEEHIYMTTVTIALCPVHYNKILQTNNGKKPKAYGKTEREAVNFILEYADMVYDTNHTSSCCGKPYSTCCGTEKTHIFVMHFVEKKKYGDAEYYTTLPMCFCEHHYNELLRKNDGKEPVAIGWDDWDAVDSIVACLDETDYQYKTVEDISNASHQELLTQFIATIATP